MTDTAANFDATADELVRLLPSVHQILDARGDGGDGFLRTLLGLVGEQVDELRDDLAALYDDLFIETCSPWAVPYIGDLVGVTGEHDIAGIVTTTRAQVANVLGFRRRKGTADVVEELATSITDWSARVVEMFTTLAITTNLDHVRRRPPATMSLRSARDLELIDSAFDPFAHNVDVRWIASRRGRHNVPNVAIFLWPETGMPFLDVEAAAVDATRFRFHPLGIDTTLVTNQAPPATVGAAATTKEVPWPISIRALDADLAASGTTAGSPGQALYSESGSILVELVGGPPITADIIVACSLGDVDDTWEHLDDIPAGRLAIDPRRGRLALGAGLAGAPIVSFHQTLTGPIGGGAYGRSFPTPSGDADAVVSRAQVAAPHQTIGSALAAVAGEGLVVIDDSFTYVESLSTPANAGRRLEIRAADRRRPLLRAGDGVELICADGATVVLDGLLLAGGAVVVRGRPATVHLRDCTLVPGIDRAADGGPLRPDEASLIIACDADVAPTIVVERCITGPILAPAQATVTISDSIVEGGTRGDPSTGPGGDDPGAVERPATSRVVVSADLTTFPTLGAAPNDLVLLASDADPVTVALGTPADAAAVAAALGAVPDVAAVAVGGRVVVTTHERGSLSVRGAPDDPTASELGFAAARNARTATMGLARSGPLTITATEPRLGLRTDANTVVEIGLAAVPADLAGAATALQVAIRAVSASPVHRSALVAVVDEALVVVPGASGHTFAFTGTAADTTTAVELGLGHDLPALAGDGNAASGPTLIADRVTFLGRVAATVLQHASDSIFAAPVVSARVQQGCARFSYLAPGSRPPRRYRCLPDHDCEPVLAFRSTRWGSPSYGALVELDAVAPIRTGSSTGNEMGAFAGFQHRHRESNLRHQLEEFLRFSLEAGLLDGRSSKHVGGTT